jgi:hypothetical protein
VNPARRTTRSSQTTRSTASMNEAWSMEEVGRCVKEKYICSLFGVERSKSFFAGESDYRFSGCLRLEPNRFDTGFYSRHRIHRRFSPVTNRHLAGYPAHSKDDMAGMSSVSPGTSVRVAAQSSSRSYYHTHLAFNISFLGTVGMAVCK